MASVFNVVSNFVTNVLGRTVPAPPRTVPPNTTPRLPPITNRPIIIGPSPLPVVRTGSTAPSPFLTTKDSGIAPADSIFVDLNFEAIPVYNFYMQDEEYNDTIQLQNRYLGDVPRLVKLVWDPAPDLEWEMITAKKNTQKPGSSFFEPAPSGPASGQVPSYVFAGIVFRPLQLRPTNFADLANMLANSDISPGVIKTTVDLPLMPAGRRDQSTAIAIDIDAFSVSPELRGISVNELTAQIYQMTNGIFQLPQIYQTNMAVSTLSLRSGAFDGQYAVIRPSFVDAAGRIMSVNPSSPAMSLRLVPAVTSRTTYTPRAQELYSPVAAPFSSNTAEDANSVKVYFVDTGLGGVVDQARINSITDPAHATNVMSIGQMLPNLVAYAETSLRHSFRTIALKSFDCPAGLPEREYVGYIIEKYELVNGVAVLREIIGINDRLTTSYYDTKVRYGGVYRYRIRAILRWVRPRNIGATGVDPVMTISANTINTLTPNFASYFGGQWYRKWGTAHVIDRSAPNPPDQLNVRPISEKKLIEISFAIPDNSQLDIYKMVLYRKMINDNGDDIPGAGWSVLAEFDMTSPGYYLDQAVDFYQKNGRTRYVYAARSFTVHDETSMLSEQIAARLNENYEHDDEFPVDFISSAGVDMDLATGVFTTIPERKHFSLIEVKPDQQGGSPVRVNFSGQERMARSMASQQDYIVRVESLDTGQVYDLPLSVNLSDQPTQVISEANNIYISQDLSLDEQIRNFQTKNRQLGI